MTFFTPDPKKTTSLRSGLKCSSMIFLLHWLIYVPKTIHTNFYENRMTGTRFFRHSNFVHFWLLGDSTMGGLLPHFFDFWFFTVKFALSWLQKCFKAYVSPISTIICRKTRIKINLKSRFRPIAQWGSTTSLLEGSFEHFPSEFLTNFSTKSSKKKKT